MVLIGRLTKDAVVAQLKDEREVVNFTLAVNDYYNLLVMWIRLRFINR